MYVSVALNLYSLLFINYKRLLSLLTLYLTSIIQLKFIFNNIIIFELYYN